MKVESFKRYTLIDGKIRTPNPNGTRLTEAQRRQYLFAREKFGDSNPPNTALTTLRYYPNSWANSNGKLSADYTRESALKRYPAFIANGETPRTAWANAFRIARAESAKENEDFEKWFFANYPYIAP